GDVLTVLRPAPPGRPTATPPHVHPFTPDRLPQSATFESVCATPGRLPQSALLRSYACHWHGARHAWLRPSWRPPALTGFPIVSEKFFTLGRVPTPYRGNLYLVR